MLWIIITLNKIIFTFKLDCKEIGDSSRCVSSWGDDDRICRRDNGRSDNGRDDNGGGDNGGGDNGRDDDGRGDNGRDDNGRGDNGGGDNSCEDNGRGDNDINRYNVGSILLKIEKHVCK